MLTKTFTAENQWSDPILIPAANRLLYQVEETVASLVAVISIQRIPDFSDPAQPNDNSTDWKTVKEFDAGSDPSCDILAFGAGWYRMGVATGDYTSGTGKITLQIANP
jgi:hypothetical protein